MMKKLLLAIFVFAMCVAGCGTSPKEEAETFNNKYYKQAFVDGLTVEINNALNQSIAKYGDTTEADLHLNEFIQYNEKFTELFNTINNVKIENKEVEPLKADLLNYINNCKEFINAATTDNFNATQELYINRAKSKFDYLNEYEKITTGKGLPVMNTNIGQLYAYMVSDVVFTVTDVSESDYIGNGYFGKQPQGKFILVKVISFNNQKDAVTIDSNLFKLINANNQEYSTSVEGMTAMNLSNGNAEGFLQQVNPGMSIEATYVFDVPANSKIADYKLQARGGMTGDKVTMPLKVERTGY